MLTRYRHLTATFPIIKAPLQPIPICNFSFKRLSEDMEIRRKQRYDIGESNFKAAQKRKWFYERAHDYVLNNKKKLTFFFVLCGILNFYVGYKGFVKFSRKLDPVKLQLKIWFLGEKQFIPESIEETFMSGEGIRLSHNTNDALSNLFVETDRHLKYGVNKKFLAKLYTKLNCFSTKEERKDFYRDSVYSNKRNQEMSGLSLKQFLLLFQKMLKKARREDSSVNEVEFLRRLQAVWDETELETKVWEKEVLKRKSEENRGGKSSIEERHKLLHNIMREEPGLSLEEFNKRVVERGHQGLGIREKVYILELELKRMSSLRADLLPKVHSFSLESIQSHDKDRERELTEKIAGIEKALGELRIDYRRTFDKSVKHGEIS